MKRMKAFLFWIGGIIAFVIVARLLRGRVPEPVALGFGFFAMWVTGYPVVNYMAGRRVPFMAHVFSAAAGALIGTLFFALLE
ncbi:MAG TPA: hypothetical protein VF723_05350 [Pyrinomonadaceae bacterium]